MSSQNSTVGPTSTTGPGAVTLEKASDIQNIQQSIQNIQNIQHHLDCQQSHQSHQPMDLAPRGPSVVQLRPLRPVFNTLPHGTTLAKTQMGQTITAVAAGTPIISVNRTPQANLTLLPARGPGGPVGPGGQTQGLPTYQLTRVGSVRAGGQQPASITVTPITSNIRLTGATVNNGAWIQSSPGAFTTGTPIRAATITVGGRPVRPDGKMIHIPQQHVTQLHMVDSKGSIIKPQMSTPIVSIRGTLPGGANQGTPVALPISPFTIRTANITNLPTLHQRPQISNTTTANQVHKVITQAGHGPPIQFVNANKNHPHVIQAITPIPRLSTVSLLLSTNATLSPINSSPVVAVASRHAGGGPSLVMTPSLGGSIVPGGQIPITKVYPMGREMVDTIFAAPNSSASGNAVTVSVNTTSGQGIHATPTSVVVATPHSGAHGQLHHPHHVVVHTPTINVHATNASAAGLPPPNMGPGSMAPSFYVDKNFSVNLVQAHQPQARPISFEKKMDSKGGPPPGSMIFTTTHPHLHPGSGNHGTTVTIPIAPHGTQHLNIAHTIPLSHQTGHNHHSLQAGSTQILTHIPAGQHHFTSSILTAVSTPSITVTGPTNYQGQSLSAVSTQSYSIPTHVISQSIGAPMSNSSNSILTVTTTAVSTNISNLNTTTVSNSTSNNPTSTSGSTTSTSVAPTTAASNSSSNSLSTATPAQSPNQTKSTHSPRPSILRKRELGESHLSTRAQRNLTHSLNFAVNNSNTGLSSASSASAAAAAANKENAVSIEKIPTTTTSSNTSGVSILKKEFQPPTEESSWQSVSSNSSSGSSTISTTSETAELQMQQQQLSVVGQGLVDLSSVNLTTHNIYLYEQPSTNTPAVSGTVISNTGAGASNATATGAGGTSSSQNGVVRSVSAAVQGRARSSSTSKGVSKDLERVKSKEKDDAVSPRKKPRKQQLTSSELLESASPEIYYQGKGKRFRKSEQVDFNEGFVEKLGIEPIPEEPPPQKVVYYVKKPHMSLLQTNQISPRPNSTHFQRYCDVKPKDDRRPTISDLANQKNVLQKVSGWRLQHMTSQMDQVIDAENGVVNKFSGLLSRLEAKVGPNCQDRDLNRVVELLKGNIQRCKVIRDQMSESRAQALKVLEHKPYISEVINKYTSKTNDSNNSGNNSKRPAKKRDRL